MKRWWLLLAATALACALSPFRGTDVGKLRPAQWVYLSRTEEGVLAETDLGDLGKGSNVLQALDDLGGSAPGALFLETADYILVSPDCTGLLSELGGRMRSAAAVYEAQMPPDEKTAAFLEAHETNVTLRNWLCGEKFLPKLIREEERWILVDR